MKKFQYLWLILFFSCNNSSPFQNVQCKEPTSYTVFKPCRQLTYQVKFWDTDYTLISDNKVWIMATGNSWEYSDQQQELLIAYEFDSTDVDRINGYAVNKSLDRLFWQKQEATGIIENESSIWMHPFRSNQYNFTEVAPFPSVRLPLEIGKTWSSTLSIYEGWGDWENSTLTNTYEIVGFEELQTPYGQLESWHVSSITEATFGNSTHNFWFHPELGFIKMVIHNYAGQTLEIELIEVNEI